MKLVFNIGNKNYVLNYHQIIEKCNMKLIYKVCFFNINYQSRLD